MDWSPVSLVWAYNLHVMGPIYSQNGLVRLDSGQDEEGLGNSIERPRETPGILWREIWPGSAHVSRFRAKNPSIPSSSPPPPANPYCLSATLLFLLSTNHNVRFSIQSFQVEEDRKVKLEGRSNQSSRSRSMELQNPREARPPPAPRSKWLRRTLH